MTDQTLTLARLVEGRTRSWLPQGENNELLYNLNAVEADRVCLQVATDIRIGTRTDKDSSNEHKRDSVKQFLAANQ